MTISVVYLIPFVSKRTPVHTVFDQWSEFTAGRYEINFLPNGSIVFPEILTQHRTTPNLAADAKWGKKVKCVVVGIGCITKFSVSGRKPFLFTTEELRFGLATSPK